MRSVSARLIALNKPFDMLSQFGQGTTPPANGALRRTLAEVVEIPDIYPVGRLDRDSEGLLLLSGDGALQHRISAPGSHLVKRYLVQVDGEPDAGAVATLLRGVMLKDGPARAVGAALIAEPALWPRDPPVRVRRAISTAWLSLDIDEGRNRQVRRMTAAIGHPTLRLVRVAIGPWQLGALAPGAWRDEDAGQLPLPARRPAHRHVRRPGPPRKFR